MEKESLFIGIIIGIFFGIVMGLVIGLYYVVKGTIDLDEYEIGYKDGFDFVASRNADDSIFDYLGNIKEIPPQLRGCYLNYYLETNEGWEKQYYDYRNYSNGEMILYNDYAERIDCEKYYGTI